MPSGRSHLLVPRSRVFEKMDKNSPWIHLESPNSVQPITKLIHLDLVIKSISSSKPNQPPNPTLPRLTLGLRCTEKRLAGGPTECRLPDGFVLHRKSSCSKKKHVWLEGFMSIVCVNIYICVCVYLWTFIYSFSLSIYIYMFTFIYI